jgi:hypothetical protein
LPPVEPESLICSSRHRLREWVGGLRPPDHLV